MLTDQHRDREGDYDVTKPRIAVYEHTWKIHQITVYWCNFRVVQREIKHDPTRSAFTTLYLRCASKRW